MLKNCKEKTVAVRDEKRSKLWLLFVMGYFSLLLSLSILYHLDHSSLQFCLILGGMNSTVHPYLLLLGLNVLVFFLYSLFQLLQITAVLCQTSTLEGLFWVFC